MIPLMLGIGIDFYLIARVILADRVISGIVALILMGAFSSVWFLLPRLASLQHGMSGRN